MSGNTHQQAERSVPLVIQQATRWQRMQNPSAASALTTVGAADNNRPIAADHLRGPGAQDQHHQDQQHKKCVNPLGSKATSAIVRHLLSIFSILVSAGRSDCPRSMPIALGGKKRLLIMLQSRGSTRVVTNLSHGEHAIIGEAVEAAAVIRSG